MRISDALTRRGGIAGAGRFVRFAALLAACAGALFACTDVPGSTTGPDRDGRGIQLVLRPQFHVAGTASHSPPINLARLTVMNAATRALIAGPLSFTVDPNLPAFSLPVEFDLPTGVSSLNIVVAVQLLNVTAGVESIEWSGITSTISVSAGNSSPTPATINVVQGPPGNLDVTSITIQNKPAAAVEGDSMRLIAIAQGATDIRIFWETSDVAVATVDSTGLVRVLRGGNVSITAWAGVHSDTAHIATRSRVASVRVSPDTLRAVSVGDELVFAASLTDSRGAVIPDETVTWSSADESVAGSLGAGRFAARANGLTQIRATSTSSPGVSAVAFVVVTQRVAQIALDLGGLEFTAIGDMHAFIATAADARGNPVAPAGILWSTSDAGVVSISDDGIATAVAPGTATITATSPDGPVASATVSVRPVVTALSLSPSSVSFNAVGDTARLAARSTDHNGNPVAAPAVVWTSSASGVASVDSTGLVRAVARGTAVITASAGTTGATATVTVEPIASRIDVMPADVLLTTIGATAPFGAQAFDRNGHPVTAAVVWSTSAPSVASVDGAGVARAVANGTATITATIGGISGSATVRVQQAVATITASPGEFTAGDVGTSFTITVTAEDAAGNPAPTGEVSWVSSDPSIATVDQSGTVTTTGFGETSVIVSAGAAADTVRISVVRPTLVLTPESLAFTAIGQTHTVTAVRRDVGGSSEPVSPAWSSSNTAVATVNASGLVTATGAGSAEITAANGDVTASIPVTVENTGVEFHLTPDFIALEPSATGTVTARDEDDQVVAATFTSLHPEVATVSPSGEITAVANGYARIVGTYNDESVTALVQVGPGVPEIEGVTKTWVGTANPDNPDWSDPANWLPYGVPTSSDFVFIPDCAVFYELLTPSDYLGGCTATLSDNANIGALTTGYYFFVEPPPGVIAGVRSGEPRSVYAGDRGTAAQAVRRAKVRAAIDSARTANGVAPVTRSAAARSQIEFSGNRRQNASRAGETLRKALPHVSSIKRVLGTARSMEQEAHHIDVNGHVATISGDVVDFAAIGAVSFLGRVVLDGSDQQIMALAANIDVDVTGSDVRVGSPFNDEEYYYYDFETGLFAYGNLTVSGTLTLEDDAEASVYYSDPYDTGGEKGDFIVTGQLMLHEDAFVSASRDMRIDEGSVTTQGGEISINRDIIVEANGEFEIGYYSFVYVDRRFVTRTSGTLDMHSYAAYLDVYGDAEFNGASTNGRLTDGRIYIYGDLTVGNMPGSSVTAFAPSGNHTTEFGADESDAHIVSMANPGAGSTGNHFAILVVNQGSVLTSATPFFVDGDGIPYDSETNPQFDAYVCGSVNAPQVTINGTLGLCTLGEWNVTNTILTGENSGVHVDYYETIPTLTTNLTIRGQTSLHNLRIDGDLEIDGNFGGDFTAGNGVTVEGDVTIHHDGVLTIPMWSSLVVEGSIATLSGGRFNMDVDTELDVNDIVLNGGISSWDGGQITLHGDLTAANSSQISATAAHTIYLADDAQPETTTIAIGANSLGSIDMGWSDGFTVDGSLDLLGRLIDTNPDGIQTIVGVGTGTPSITVHGYSQLQYTVFQNVTLDTEIADPVATALNHVSFTSFASDVTQLTMRSDSLSADTLTIDYISFDTNELFNAPYIAMIGGATVTVQYPNPNNHDGRKSGNVVWVAFIVE